MLYQPPFSPPFEHQVNDADSIIRDLWLNGLLVPWNDCIYSFVTRFTTTWRFVNFPVCIIFHVPVTSVYVLLVVLRVSLYGHLKAISVANYLFLEVSGFWKYVLYQSDKTKTRIAAAEMKFMTRMAKKHTWVDRERNEEVLNELKMESLYIYI